MRNIFTLLLFVALGPVLSAQLIINEVLYDPSNNALDGDANGDGVYDQEGDSFIEFINTGTTNFDASGYQIWDDTSSTGTLRYVVPIGTLVPPGGAMVVFGSGPLVGNFGGAVLLSADTTTSHLNLNNSGEVIAIKDPAGNTVLLFDSDALSNNPNESYTRNPDITGAFEQHADNTSLLFSPGTKVDGTPFDTNFVVSAIAVSGQGGATSITTPGGTLQMTATVVPTFAADTTVTWSVPAANGVATIDANGLLTAVTNGSVQVKATTNDGTNLADSVTITVSNQNIGLEETSAALRLEVFPNPATNELQLKTATPLSQVRIYTLQGQLIMEMADADVIDISALAPGSYILEAATAELRVQQAFNKL
jgi:hypothetical protein